jgi:hypothetical protein
VASRVKPQREPVKCANPGCRKQFVPAHGKHMYCSAACKMRVVQYGHALGIGRR